MSTFPLRAVCNTGVLPDKTSSAVSIAWARRQILDCRVKHTCLPEMKSTPLPTRVLDVSGPDEAVVKLLVTSRQPARYTCLSHCWGDQTSIVRTTRSTLRDHVEGIRIVKLPATFRDAADFTRRLGIKYIWIDSLCIIQDSEEDWQAESARMAEIYENSYVTLAATMSTNGQGGCYRTTSGTERDLELETHSDVDEPTRLYLRPQLGHFDLSPDVHISEQGSDFPLLKRAWVLQERLLSPRMLHFCDRELIFECRETIHCQCGEAQVQANMKAEFIRMLESGPSRRPARARVGWWTLVQRYTRLRLTFDKDRLPALSGMARRRMGQQANDYMAGIWRSSFPDGLLWRVDFPSRVLNAAVVLPRRLPEPRAPSWSWASLAAAVTWVFPHRFGDKTVGIEILEADCFPVGNDRYGQVQGGILRVTGLITNSVMQRKERWSLRATRTAMVMVVLMVSELDFLNATFQIFRHCQKKSATISRIPFIRTMTSVLKNKVRLRSSVSGSCPQGCLFSGW